MVFKKNDERTKLAAQQGGLKAQEKHPDSAQIMVERRDTNIYSERCKKMNQDKEHQRNAGKFSAFWENLAIERFNKDFGNKNIFRPSEVCDRICVKGDKITFIEVKRIKSGKKEKLRPKQEAFKNFCEINGYTYQVIYIDAENNKAYYEELYKSGQAVFS
jgi:ribosomal protein L44E